MEVGTQILIERMQTHPEEFEEGKISKWARHVSYAMEWLPEEDKQALREAIEKRRIAHFNESVLKELAGEQDSEVEETPTLKYKATERYVGGWTDPRVMLEKEMQDRWALRNDSLKFKAIDEGLKSWRTK